ncbi:recombinase family protein [Candidatus Woesearchaeota archaeon]|nr:recombinase family protein [Candidatus Woesearchaeota archaeon]
MNYKNCAIYTRVSTDNQAEKEFSSCDAQEQKMRSFIASQDNWQVSKVYSDAGFSGATTERPALQELLTDLEKEKIDIVFVYKIDRLTRSPKDFYQLIEFFEQSKIDFISITERFDTSTPAGRLLRNIMLTFSQFERELASERTKDKLLERAKKGMCNGGLTSYGYMRENKKLIPHPKGKEIIELIFEKYLETKSLSAVYKDLKERDVKNKNGKNFSKTNVAHILRNVIYIGKVKYNGEIYQGVHNALISEEIFDIAQKIHKNKMKKFRVYKNFLFGGLIKCEDCGSNMTSCFTNKRTNGNLTRYNYYRCTSTFSKDWQSCSVKQVSAERLENFCLENLERISIDTNYIENLVFRLNNDFQARYGAGYEPTEVCSNFPRFSSEKIANTLNFFITAIKNSKGIERNLSAKRFLEKIIYTPENIKISFFQSQNCQNPADFGETQNTVPLLRNGAKRSPQNFFANRRESEKSSSSKNQKFVSLNSAPQVGLEPTTNSLTGNCSTIELLWNLYILLKFG